MSDTTRRAWMKMGLGASAGVAGVAVAAQIADAYGLLPPSCGGLYGPGEGLTYAAHRMLMGQSMAREFDRRLISARPFANGKAPKLEEYQKQVAGGFRDWKLVVDGMVARPGAYTIAELKTYPVRSQITQLTCEEGWSFIAEWTGTPLSHVLNVAGVLPQAKYAVYFSMEPEWWDSVELGEAMHPQTLVTYGMNGGELPGGHGGPLRLRVPRQLAYKSVKFITRITLTDSLKGFRNGKGSSGAEYGYSWYAGI